MNVSSSIGNNDDYCRYLFLSSAFYCSPYVQCDVVVASKVNVVTLFMCYHRSTHLSSRCHQHHTIVFLQLMSLFSVNNVLHIQNRTHPPPSSPPPLRQGYTHHNNYYYSMKAAMSRRRSSEMTTSVSLNDR